MNIDIDTLNTEDIIDVRDIIERIEFLESEIEDARESGDIECIEASEPELNALTAIMEELAGNGGDESWNGDWYPVTLIRESHFTDYIKELIHECYEMPPEMKTGRWPYCHITIDYEAAARDAKVDYSTVEIDGVTYFYR